MTSPNVTMRLRAVLTAIRDRLSDEGFALIAGLLGALASVIVMGVLRFAWGAPTLPELVGQRILPLLPVDLFIRMLVTFQPHSKTTPLGLALLGQIVLGIVLGPLYHRLAQVPARLERFMLTRRALIVAGAFVIAMEVLAAIAFWSVIYESLVGYPNGAARLVTLLAMLLTFIAFVGIMMLVDHALRLDWSSVLAKRLPSETNAETLSRRTLLAETGVLVVTVATGVLVTDNLINAYLKRSNLAYEGMATPGNVRAAITPTEDFYIVSKNVLDPIVIADNWRLDITGLVGKPTSWTYNAVRKLPVERRAITLECISNDTGAHLLSTANWRGVTLADALDAAGGVIAGGQYVIFRSVDGFATSLPLADLLEAKALLAWEMNDAPLNDRHGFPLRVVVPGRYGEQSAKWLTQIEVSDQPFKGFYQSQGWGANQVSTTSRIDTPTKTATLAPLTVAGVAFSGIRGISRVEVSADGGASWHEATLEPALSDQTWVLWSWQWTPTARGTYKLTVRAADGTGTLQTAEKHSIVPDGATGLHTVTVQVR